MGPGRCFILWSSQAYCSIERKWMESVMEHVRLFDFLEEDVGKILKIKGNHGKSFDFLQITCFTQNTPVPSGNK